MQAGDSALLTKSRISLKTPPVMIVALISLSRRRSRSAAGDRA
jgi:hypothetical protein